MSVPDCELDDDDIQCVECGIAPFAGLIAGLCQECKKHWLDEYADVKIQDAKEGL